MDLDVLHSISQVIEGFLDCTGCGAKYPIVSGVAIMWKDFDAYVAERASLFGRLYAESASQKMRHHIRASLSRARPIRDVSDSENQWAQIYTNSARSRFYGTISKILSIYGCSVQNHNRSMLEHGCSIGLLHRHRDDISFGIDRSFAAVQKARSYTEVEFVVADSLAHPFGRTKFDTVVALNMLEIVEPGPLLETVSKQAKNTIIVSTPYDYRPERHISRPLDAQQVRDRLRRLGFGIAPGYTKPIRVPWRLIINDRAVLQYYVDVMVAVR